MSIENRRQCENARAKLNDLEQFYKKKRQEPQDERIRQFTLSSLKSRINQFKEETARFEARAGSAVVPESPSKRAT
jgi:hypothetical protein